MATSVTSIKHWPSVLECYTASGSFPTFTAGPACVTYGMVNLLPIGNTPFRNAINNDFIDVYSVGFGVTGLTISGSAAITTACGVMWGFGKISASYQPAAVANWPLANIAAQGMPSWGLPMSTSIATNIQNVFGWGSLIVPTTLTAMTTFPLTIGVDENTQPIIRLRGDESLGMWIGVFNNDVAATINLVFLAAGALYNNITFNVRFVRGSNY